MQTIFTINPKDLARVDEERLAVHFLQELLWAEAARISIPVGNINITLNTKVADGGIDASVIKRPKDIRSSIFPDEFNGYQIKTGASFKPWDKTAIKKELFGRKKSHPQNLGKRVHHCLQQDGTYILVCFGHDLTDEQRSAAKTHLQGFLSDCGYAHPKVDVWSRNNLCSFLKPFPSLALQLNGRSNNFQSHNSWSRDASMQLPFVPGTEQMQLVEGLREGIRNYTNHIRVWGEPGIGKTRLVFEATRAEDIDPLVIYCNANEFLHSNLFYEMLQPDNGYKAVLVLDECDADKRAEISRRFKNLSPRIRIVTIYSEYDNASDINYLNVPPLDDIEICQIIQQYSVPKDEAQKWGSACGGSPRVAHMVGLNLKENPNDLLREPDTERVWDRYIIGADDPNSLDVKQRRVVLQYLSLFKRFGFGDPVQAEAKAIHKLIQRDNPDISWGQFSRTITILKQRRILQGHTTLYITPKLLHIRLWLDWWESYGSAIGNEIVLSIPSPLLDWFFEMFEYAAGSATASRTVRNLLGVNGLFLNYPETLQSQLGSRFFRYLGQVEPKEALNCLQHILSNLSKEDLKEFSEGRREIVELLAQTAQWRDLFRKSAMFLLDLAEAENETWSNNATGTFTDLFYVSEHKQLSPTEASPDERFFVIEEAMNSESKERRMLALKACDKVLTRRTYGSIQTELAIFRNKPDLWMPKTWGEYFDAYRRVWHFLQAKIEVLHEDERNTAIQILLSHIHPMGVQANLSEMIAETVYLLAEKTFVDKRKLLEKVIQILHHGRESLASETVSLWEKVKDDLEGDDYASKMKRFVGMNLLEDKYDSNGKRTDQVPLRLQELAEFSVANPYLFDEQLDWLVTSDAINGYQFGYILAGLDKGYSLLAEIVDAQKRIQENASLFFLGGYLRNYFEADPLAWENLMDSWVDNKQAQNWILELTWRVGEVSRQGAERILRMIKSSIFPSWHLDIFTYGTDINSLPNESFCAWIELLLEDTEPKAAYIALGLYSRYFVSSDIQRNMPEDLTEKILTHKALSELPDTFQKRQIMYPYDWKLIAQRFIKENAARSLILSEFIIRHFDKPHSIFSDLHQGPREILRAIIVQYPEDVWKQMIPYLEESYSWELTKWLRGNSFFWKLSDKADNSALSLIPLEVVCQWIEKDIDNRAWYVASFVPPVLERDEANACWVWELLVRYGDREDVRRNLSANFSTEGWTGDESIHLEGKKKRLLEFKQKETNVNVIQWINEFVDELEKRIKSARILEERGY